MAAPKLSPALKKQLKERLICLWNSCDEGFDGTWDCTGEGKDGFIAMEDGIEAIMALLGIKVNTDKFRK
jgi:hypothetical protein